MKSSVSSVKGILSLLCPEIIARPPPARKRSQILLEFAAALWYDGMRLNNAMGGLQMRGFMKRVDLFCYKHPRFGINNLMLYIVFGTLAVWLLGAMDRTNLLESYLAFDAAAVLHGQVWRIVTFVLIPESGGIWLLLFLYFYYFIGSTLEREWGPGRFTIYYAMGMLLTIIYGFIAYFVDGRSYFMSSTYINLSMFFAFATLFPEGISSGFSSTRIQTGMADGLKT